MNLDSEYPDEPLREMLTSDQVLAIIPVSRTTLFRLERDELFPRGHGITPHRKLWFKDEVVAWQKALLDPSSAIAQAVRLNAAKARSAAKRIRKVG